MDTITTTTGNRIIAWSMIANEITGVLFDLRWMLIACAFLIYLDFHFGSAESRRRHKQAVKEGNDTLAKMYEFHLSRAIRRTFNKAIDYITWLIAFALIGLAICEPWGVCSHVVTSALGVLIACGVEIWSAAGHFCYLKGINVKLPRLSWKSAFVFVGRLAASFARTKDVDMGNAIDETLTNTLNDEKKEGGDG